MKRVYIPTKNSTFEGGRVGPMRKRTTMHADGGEIGLWGGFEGPIFWGSVVDSVARPSGVCTCMHVDFVLCVTCRLNGQRANNTTNSGRNIEHAIKIELALSMHACRTHMYTRGRFCRK